MPWRIPEAEQDCLNPKAPEKGLRVEVGHKLPYLCPQREVADIYMGPAFQHAVHVGVTAIFSPLPGEN